MLIFAEGTIHRPVAEQEHAASAAWLGPMVDSEFLQSGYIDAAGQRVFMVLSTPDHETVASAQRPARRPRRAGVLSRRAG